MSSNPLSRFHSPEASTSYATNCPTISKVGRPYKSAMHPIPVSLPFSRPSSPTSAFPLSRPASPTAFSPFPIQALPSHLNSSRFCLPFSWKKKEESKHTAELQACAEYGSDAQEFTVRVEPDFITTCIVIRPHSKRRAAVRSLFVRRPRTCTSNHRSLASLGWFSAPQPPTVRASSDEEKMTLTAKPVEVNVRIDVAVESRARD